MVLQQNIAFLFIVFLTFILIGQVKADEPNIDIAGIRYTNDFENGDPITIVSSGKDDATAYNYNFYDDDDDDCDQQSCIPENWYAVDFDDSSWSSGAAPFGNDELDEVSPGTIWQTEEGGLNDYLIIRHHFTYSGEYEALSATLNLAYNNYYTAYLNGNLIRSCGWGCGESDAEYWNNELTYDGSSESGPNPDWLVEGENVLAILGIDSTWGGGDGEQWLDVELVVNVQAWTENPIVLGDELMLRIDFFNNEENNATNLDITLEIDELIFANQTIEIENNKTFEWKVDWTPDRLGEFNVTAKVLNESLTRFIHVGYYAYNFSVDDDYNVGNTSEILTYNITISNEGDMDDNYTFQIFGTDSAWDVDFVPSIINLAPGETGAVILEITPDNNTYSGIYELTLTARSQYHGEIENMIVQSGRDNGTEWKWVNSTGGRLYEESNTTWTEIDFVPNSNWTLSPAPFGDDDLSGIDYNTEWTGNNYAYFRHIFYIEDLSYYENDTLSLNMAANNYGTYYLNGHEIFNDMGWGQGHNARYWNEEIKFNTSLLKEGKNVLASVVRETGNTQWFDEELISVTPKSTAWGFQPDYISLKLEVLPVYDFELVAPISDKAVSQNEVCCEHEWNYRFEIWGYNEGNIEDSYEISITLNDTINFTIVDYDSIVHADFAEEVTIDLTIALNSSVTEFSVGEFNISMTSMNSTTLDTKYIIVKARLYVIPDTLSPGTYTQSPELINNSSFEVNWYVEEWYKTNKIMGNDTKYFIIEYMTDNGTNGENWGDWIFWNNFSSEISSAIFPYGIDGYNYRFRSMGGDDEGLVEDKEDKYDSQTLVDLSAPYAIVNLRLTSNLTNFDYIEIEWHLNHTNITSYSIEYRLNDNQTWINIEENTLAKWVGFNIPIDGIYEFRVLAYDEAGNEGISDTTNKLTVDRSAPVTNLVDIPELIGSNSIFMNIENLDDTVNLSLYYSLSKEGEEIFPLEWILYGEYMVNDFPISINTINENHYYFRIIAYDLVGNYILNESYEEFIVDQNIPENIRKLELKDTKEINNGATNITITFQGSQSQDVIGYRIYRSINQNETGEIVGYKEADKLYLSYRDLDVILGHKYYYSVVAVDRMDYESDVEVSSIVLEIEEETVEESENESSNNALFIGAGLLGLVGLGGAGYYFIGNKGNEELITGIAEVVETEEIIESDVTDSKFTEIDGELLCSACGSMFEISGEKICPSCGTFDE